MWNDYSYVVESLRVINNLVVYNLLHFHIETLEERQNAYE